MGFTWLKSLRRLAYSIAHICGPIVAQISAKMLNLSILTHSYNLGVNRFALKRQHTKNAFVKAEGFFVYESLQRPLVPRRIHEEQAIVSC